jgi:hypothetical protein
VHLHIGVAWNYSCISLSFHIIFVTLQLHVVVRCAMLSDRQRYNSSGRSHSPIGPLFHTSGFRKVLLEDL